MSEDNSKKSLRLSRRDLVKGLGLTGAAGVMAGLFQNCSGPASFEAAQTGSDALASSASTCFNPTPPLCEAGGNTLSGKIVTPASTSGDEHSIQAAVYKAAYHDFGMENSTQYMLAVTVGANPTMGVWHPTDFTNLTAIHTITDIFVVNKDTCEFLLWKRFNNGDPQPFALMMLDSALVSSGARLKVIASCSVHGFFGMDLDLSAPALDYNALVTAAVGAYNPSKPFGGSSMNYPYVAKSATAGQGDIGALHTPQIQKVSDNEIRAILGGFSAPHGRFAENHYVAGGALFDQNGHLLTQPIFVRYSDAGDTGSSATSGPTLDFTNLNLAARGVQRVRVVIFDTYNGMLQSFYNV